MIHIPGLLAVWAFKEPRDGVVRFGALNRLCSTKRNLVHQTGSDHQTGPDHQSDPEPQKALKPDPSDESQKRWERDKRLKTRNNEASLTHYVLAQNSHAHSSLTAHS
jgi:hypothetical protein